MFLVDTEQGRIIDDEEIKRTVASQRPTASGSTSTRSPRRPAGCARGAGAGPGHAAAASGRVRLHVRDERIVLTPMARDGVEAVGSMATTPRLRCFPTSRGCSTTTSSSSLPGDEPADRLHPRGAHHLRGDPPRLRGQLLNPQPSDCRRLEIKWPILTNEEFAKVRRMDLPGLRIGVLPILFRVSRGEKASSSR